MHDRLYQASVCDTDGTSVVLQKEMKYCDLHCDALTTEGVLQVTPSSLKKGDCLLQCFAIFPGRREDAWEFVRKHAERFPSYCKENGYAPVTRASDVKETQINALLTVEDAGAIEGDLQKLDALYALGVRMITLTWNYPNQLGFPNFPDYEGLLCGKGRLQARENALGLTKFGREAVARMNQLGVIIDVSHGSDALVRDVAKESKKPFVASHSGIRRAFDCSRNLTDEGVRLIAESGGVIGLDFCADFLSFNQTAEGQKGAMLYHAKELIRVGGEDVLSIGSDFDGIPVNPYLKNPSYLPAFFEELCRVFSVSVAEKIAYQNFLRVFQDVCG